jgi:hypothetical protein
MVSLQPARASDPTNPTFDEFGFRMGGRVDLVHGVFAGPFRLEPGLIQGYPNGRSGGSLPKFPGIAGNFECHITGYRKVTSQGY